MPFLHMSRSVSQVRSYDEPDGYSRRIPYKAIVTITHLTESLAYLHSAVGTLRRDDFPALLAMLKEQGVTTVMFERHGRLKTRNL